MGGAVALGLVLVVACSPTDTDGAIPRTATDSAPRTSVLGTAPPPAEAPSGYAVGTLHRDFVDDRRGRTLPTLVHYPAEGPVGEPGSTPAEGSFPVVLMAHGFQLPAGGYERILTTLTAAGYVTVSPAFPHTSAEVGDGQRGDIVNQPADLTFVLDQIVALAAESSGRLPALAQPDRVGAIGHSDGGLTVSALAYNALYRDPRIAATVVMTGGRALFPGSYFDVTDPPPVLAVHGTADGNPYSGSQSLVRDAAALGVPAYLLTIEQGGHIDPYMFDTARTDLAATITAFMDLHLLDRPEAGEQMLEAGNVDGALRLEVG